MRPWDTQNHVTTYAYNAQNQVQSVTDPNTGISRYAYDAAGNLATFTDARSNATTLAHDGFGHLITQVNPDTGTTAFAYDASNRVTQMTRADTTVTSYSYDALNRPYQVIAGGQAMTFSYDSCTNGHTRLCGITDPSGTTSYGYRVTGQIASQTAVIAGASYATSFGYDNQDRLTSLTYPGGNSVQYAYDIMSNPLWVTATIAGVSKSVASGMTYVGNGFGSRSGMTMGNGLAVAMLYDKDFRLSQLTAGTGQTFVQALGYGYDSDNNLQLITNFNNNSQSETYGYDPKYRLTSATATSPGNQSWSYDANDNRLSSNDGGSFSYTPATASNRLLALTAAGSTSNYGYDALGNLTSTASATYGYDAFNRMTSATTAGATTSYAYNASNQRTRKTGPGGNYSYAYAPGGTLLGETANGGSTLTTEYVWLGNQPLGVIRNNVLYYVQADHLGRPDTVTSSTKAVVWKAQNLAFSRTVTTDSIGGLNLGFPGQYWDSESGLFYNLNRYYNPVTGRYLQSDPIGLLGGSNTYGYVGGNSVGYTDSSWLIKYRDLAFGIVDTGFGLAQGLGGLGVMIVSTATGPATPVIFYGGTLLSIRGIVGAANGMRAIGYAFNDTSGPGIFESLLSSVGDGGARIGKLIDIGFGVSTLIREAGNPEDL